MRIKITHRPGFLLGSRFVCPEDGPLEVEETRGRALVAAGLAAACAPLEAMPSDEVMHALHPAPERAERAIARPARRQTGPA